MTLSGNLVVLGDAGDALGDAIYEARFFVRGTVKSLDADCVEKEMRDEYRQAPRGMLDAAGSDEPVQVKDFRRYGSTRDLYDFHADNGSAC